MSFLRPHTIAISRPTAAPIAGDGGYGALSRQSETVIYGAIDDQGRVTSGIAAGLTPGTGVPDASAKVPSDTAGRVSPWRFTLSPRDVPRGTVKLRDIVTDETGQRYQVLVPLWNALECNLRCHPLAG